MPSAGLSDISDRAELEILVSAFYKRITIDPLIGHFFSEVMDKGLEKHLPQVVDFWEQLLFGSNSYSGNPMQPHLELNRIHPMKSEHFDRWLQHWENSIRDSFNGEKADEAIQRARHIASVMEFKVKHAD